MTRPLAPHVQAAISAAAQPRLGAAPAARSVPAAHVQAAVARTVQPKPAAPEIRPPAPHVQTALVAAAQPRIAPPPPRPPAPHVQAAVQPRSALAPPPARPQAPHVQASLAAAQPKSSPGVIQQVRFRARFQKKYQLVDSKDVVKNPETYVKASAVHKALEAISKGEEFRKEYTGEDKRKKYYTTTPTREDQAEAKAALEILGKSTEFNVKKRKKEKRDREALRLAEVGKQVKILSKSIKDEEYEMGMILSEFGKESSIFSLEKFKRTPDFQINVDTIKGQTDNKAPILVGQTPWRQMESLMQSEVNSKNLNLGGQSIWFSQFVPDTSPNPLHVMVNLGSGSSYHEMSKKTKVKVKDDLGHQQLYVLDRIRDRRSSVSEHIKEDLYRKDYLTPEERFGDTLNTTYQEFKKETRENFPAAVERIQISSAYFNLLRATRKMGDTEIGSRVLDRKRSIGGKIVYRPQTTPKNLKRKLDEYRASGKVKDLAARKKRRLDLRKETTRLHRSIAQEDYSSEEENDI